MARRKSISERTIKALFAKSRNMCAFEGCRRMIVDETTNTVMGEIAHIEGVGKRSARHNPNLPAERLNDIARASFQRKSWMFSASRLAGYPAKRAARELAILSADF